MLRSDYSMELSKHNLNNINIDGMVIQMYIKKARNVNR